MALLLLSLLFSQVPSGFLNLKWGVSPEEVLKLRGGGLERQADIDPCVVYYIEYFKDKNSPYATARYMFYKDRLIGVFVYLKDEYSDITFTTVLDEFRERYGSEKKWYEEKDDFGRLKRRIAIWENDETKVTLIKNYPKGNFLLKVFSKKLEEWRKEDTKKRKEEEKKKKLEKVLEF